MSHESVRDEVLNALSRNFLGPIGGPGETFSAAERETPISRYMTGILFPSESTIPPVEDDGGLSTESRESADEDEARLSMCNAPNPSSYGISFGCRSEVPSLTISVVCGLYTLEKDAAGKPVQWRRTSFSKSLVVSVQTTRMVKKEKLADGLELRVTFRPPGFDGNLPITATLINTNSIKDVPWIEQSNRAFFQCKLEVSAGNDGQAPFVERRGRDTRHLDPELRHALLLYRHARLYAVGHGCAADWSPRLQDGTAPRSVFITFIPQHDVYPLIPPVDLNVPALPLVRLAKDDLPSVTQRLESLVKGYEDWTESRKQSVASTMEEFKDIAEEQLASCRESARRIRKGIAALANKDVFRAFQLSQQAMLEVFARSEWQKKRNYNPAEPPTYGEEHEWRPFQVAFILQCLESVADPASKDRDICDLLWFPTGGGKTEAYLALTAFVFFSRRLRAVKSGAGGGTAVLMRYTLRLLTADQFVRASLLTCAAENLRRREADLARTAPISIGLWVGEATTPNWLSDAADALAALHNGRRLAPDQSSPLKLKRCPWCGTPLRPAEYRMATGNTAVVIRCRNSTCEFHTGIPAAVVDEQIYQERPSLVIGTVDKFARLPWVKESGALFSTDGAHPRPDLVIQDELHLISGPLGTISGLYEAAIDHLCTAGGVPPKLIASTATIRNAESQVRHLFARRFAQFPQPLLDARDSFFAREAKPGGKVPARRFVGLFTPGKSPMTSFIRMSGSLSHAPFASGASDADKDPYWTLITYFNSLRELGGAIVRVHDDVAEYLKTLAALDDMDPAFRSLDAVEELTSRAGEEKLDEVRERLWERKQQGDPYDMVLCSNMISVGLDVPRLGLMAVIGQPKTTAEYIQATSRIGRSFPGLVVTLYNWTRSRDRSHYERFVPYHSRLYAEVEATSVTPWSSRARDRAFHAVLVTLARHLVPGMLDDNQAAAFRSDAPPVAALISALKERITRIETDPADRAAAHAHLDRIASQWQTLATASGGNLPYSGNADKALLVPFEDFLPHNPGFATMNNMRNVDAPAGLYLEP